MCVFASNEKIPSLLHPLPVLFPPLSLCPTKTNPHPILFHDPPVLSLQSLSRTIIFRSIKHDSEIENIFLPPPPSPPFTTPHLSTAHNFCPIKTTDNTSNFQLVVPPILIPFPLHPNGKLLSARLERNPLGCFLNDQKKPKNAEMEGRIM